MQLHDQIQPRGAWPSDRHQSKSHPGGAAPPRFRPGELAPSQSEDPPRRRAAPGYPGRPLHPPHGLRRGAPAARRGPCPLPITSRGLGSLGGFPWASDTQWETPEVDRTQRLAKEIAGMVFGEDTPVLTHGSVGPLSYHKHQTETSAIAPPSSPGRPADARSASSGRSVNVVGALSSLPTSSRRFGAADARSTLGQRRRAVGAEMQSGTSTSETRRLTARTRQNNTQRGAENCEALSER